MVIDQLLQLGNVGSDGLLGGGCNRMPGHRYCERMSCCVLLISSDSYRILRFCTDHAGKDLFQLVRRTLGFRFPAIQAVFEVEQWLSDWVGVRYLGRIDKGDISYSPPLVISVRQTLWLTISALDT
jgi:hypothetical protein